jgi:hypothetical protein
MSNHPWDRQRRDGELEPMLWFGRFTVYREMGTERSLLGAYNKVLKSAKRRNSIPGAWELNAKKWDWKTRAELWDQSEQDRLQFEFEADSQKWREQRFKGAEQLWDIGKQLLDTFPIVKQTVKDKDGTTIIEPISNVLAEVARVWKMADELARITTRETLPVTKVAPTDPTGEKEYQPLNLEKLTDAELERLGKLFAKIET